MFDHAQGSATGRRRGHQLYGTKELTDVTMSGEPTDGRRAV